jgi:hypothetical protein
MWKGIINSRLLLDGEPVEVQTVCHPQHDMIAARISSALRPAVRLRFAYPDVAFSATGRRTTGTQLSS